MCCIENELVNEAGFANTPFFFAVKGRISSVTDVMSQQTDWQRVIHFHNADGEELRVVDGTERLTIFELRLLRLSFWAPRYRDAFRKYLGLGLPLDLPPSAVGFQAL